MNIKTIHYGQIHRGEFEQKILDCLTDKDQTVSQIRAELIRKGIKAPAPIIRERLDVFSHFNKIIKSEYSSAHCFLFRCLPKPAFRVGNKVEPINYEHTLASGCERYPHAYVVNVSPFQLISECGDMFWSVSAKPEGFRIISESILMPKAVTDRMVVQGLLSQSPTVDIVCTCPSGDGSLQWPCPVHPPDGIHEVASSHDIPKCTVRWPANPIGNFGCVQMPMEEAAEVERKKEIVEILKTMQDNKAIILPDGMYYDFGQPMHCKCEVQVNHAALPTIEEKYNNLKSLIGDYFNHLSNIYDFGHGSHESFTKSRIIAQQINKIIEDEL